jgi:predicted acetyltransferase
MHLFIIFFVFLETKIRFLAIIAMQINDFFCLKKYFNCKKIFLNIIKNIFCNFCNYDIFAIIAAL